MRKYAVSILVALAWIGLPPFEGAFVLHRDDIRTNNHYSNLYYGTQMDNMKDRRQNGKYTKQHTQQSGKNHHRGNAKLDDQKVVEIKKKLLLGNTRNQLAEEYNVSYYTIRGIDIGGTWQHVIVTND